VCEQKEPLIKAGYRVVIPDLLGAGLSDKPAEVEAYKIEAMIPELLEILDGLSIDKYLQAFAL
jgi:epoxide hydrolase 4